MIKILFVCHGNICRSPMAEFVMKDLVKKAGLSDQFKIASAATSSEEIWNGMGNPVYRPAAKGCRGPLVHAGLRDGLAGHSGGVYGAVGRAAENPVIKVIGCKKGCRLRTKPQPVNLRFSVQYSTVAYLYCKDKGKDRGKTQREKK